MKDYNLQLSYHNLENQVGKITSLSKEEIKYILHRLKKRVALNLKLPLNFIPATLLSEKDSDQEEKEPFDLLRKLA